VQRRWQKFQSRVTYLFSLRLPAETKSAAEFRSLIGASISQIVNLLKDKTSWVCEESANTLGKLSEQGDTFPPPCGPAEKCCSGFSRIHCGVHS
jgi:hypothetical protein